MPLLKPPLSNVYIDAYWRNGMAGLWLFNEGIGNNKVFDASGNANHGTLTNMDPATDWVAGQNGWALDFDGSNDYVATASAITLPSTGWTMVAKIKSDTTPSNDCITFGNHFGNSINAYNTQFRIYLGGDLVISAVTIAANIWYTIAATNQAGTYTIYQDGRATGTATTTALEFILEYMASQGSLFLNGQMEWAAAWSRALPAADIMALSSGGPSVMFLPSWRPWYVPTGGPGSQTASPACAAAAAAAYVATCTPGAVTATLGVAAAVAAALVPTLTPGAVTVSPGVGAAAASAYTVTPTPGSVAASPAVAAAVAAGYTVTVTPGAVTASAGLANAVAAALAATATPGTVTVLPGVSAAAAAAYIVTASLPGGAQVAEPGVAGASAAAYAVTGYLSATGLRDTLVIVDLRDSLLLVDCRDAISIVDTRDNLTLH